MAYKKVIAGNDNQQNETASPHHNKINIEANGSLKIAVVFCCILIIAAIVFTAILNLQLMEILVIGSVILAFVAAWAFALSFTIRHASNTATTIAIDTAIRDRAQLERHVVTQTENYVVYRVPSGEDFRFQDTRTIQENRTILPQLPERKDPSEGILTAWDAGMSARAIEKHMKASGAEVPYRQICKVLNLYRPDWNKKGTVDSNLVEDLE